MSEDSVEEIKKEAEVLGAYSPATKMWSTILNAPTTFKKAILYSLALCIPLMIGAPNNGFRFAVIIYLLLYLVCVLLLPIFKGKQSKLMNFIHLIVAIVYILSLALLGVMFFAILFFSIGSILKWLNISETLAPYIVAVLCFIAMKIYQIKRQKIKQK